MKFNIVCLLLIALFGLIVFASIAQQNQNVPKTDMEVGALQKRVSELESKLQTVENVEKMELAAKLAEAQAKLIDTEFGKLKLELKDSNQKWLTTWGFIILGILSAGGLVLWSWLTSKMDDLIVDGIEKRLDGFKEAVEKVNILEDQFKILQKAYTVSVLENYISKSMEEQSYYRKHHVDPLSPETLSNIFWDKTFSAPIRQAAAYIMIERKLPQFVSSYFELINSAVDTDIDEMEHYVIENCIHNFRVSHTDNSYQELKKFLERLLTEELKHKN